MESHSAIFFTSEDYDTIIKIKDICKSVNINLIIEKDFCAVINKLIKVKPSFIFIDGKINNLKNFPFKIVESETFRKETKLVIISDNFVVNSCFIDVVSLTSLEKYILNSSFYYMSTNKINIDKSIINNFLLKAGFSPSHKGKDYLKECINLVLEDDIAYNCLNKSCYPIIAHIFRTEVINIDRNIRTAIKKAYAMRDKEYWEKCFGVNMDKTPTSRNFIYLCVDKLKESYNK